jgi:hypothetical protein
MRLLIVFLAAFRLSQRAVCMASVGKGDYDDFHDYTDTKDRVPQHFERLECRHCGKGFRI